MPSGQEGSDSFSDWCDAERSEGNWSGEGRDWFQDPQNSEEER